jgi:hypothetical protein
MVGKSFLVRNAHTVEQAGAFPQATEPSASVALRVGTARGNPEPHGLDGGAGGAGTTGVRALSSGRCFHLADGDHIVGVRDGDVRTGDVEQSLHVSRLGLAVRQAVPVDLEPTALPPLQAAVALLLKGALQHITLE